MTTFDQVRSEERAARAQLRADRRLQRAAQHARQRQWRGRLADALAATAKSRNGCRCGLRPSMTREQLRALGAGCTDPHHVCPRLDAVRRRLGL